MTPVGVPVSIFRMSCRTWACVKTLCGKQVRLADVLQMPGEVARDVAEFVQVVEEWPHGLDNGVDADRLPGQALLGEPLGHVRLKGVDMLKGDRVGGGDVVMFVQVGNEKSQRPA